MWLSLHYSLHLKLEPLKVPVRLKLDAMIECSTLTHSANLKWLKYFCQSSPSEFSKLRLAMNTADLLLLLIFSILEVSSQHKLFYIILETILFTIEMLFWPFSRTWRRLEIFSGDFTNGCGEKFLKIRLQSTDWFHFRYRYMKLNWLDSKKNLSPYHKLIVNKGNVWKASKSAKINKACSSWYLGGNTINVYLKTSN